MVRSFNARDASGISSSAGVVIDEAVISSSRGQKRTSNDRG